MNIAFDLRALQIGHQNRGIGMFIKSVLENLPDDKDRYIFYAFEKSNPIEELGIKLKHDYELVQTPTLKTSLDSPGDIFSLIKLVRHSFRSLKPFKPDVFVQFDFALGTPKWKYTKKIVIGYDLIPLIMKNEYLPGLKFAWKHSTTSKARLRALTRSVYYRLKYRLHYQVYKRADQIVCISHATADSFVQLLGIDAKKLHTIPLAPVLASKEVENSIAKEIAKPYLLYIGGTDSRKRIEDIVGAFNIVKDRGLDFALVLAGSEFRKVEELPNIEGRNAILKSQYRDDVHFVGFVSDSQKNGLYKSAHAFIFCTTYEGFGLPVVEAMAASCPVISYNNSSIPEAAGDAAILVETGDYKTIADNIVALQDDKLRQQIIKKGLRQAKKFSWETYIDEFKKILTESPKD